MLLYFWSKNKSQDGWFLIYMLNKHFFKTLLIFTGMIAIGLIGVFLISYFDKDGSSVEAPMEDVLN